jgi:diaminopimelate decarboxylase
MNTPFYYYDVSLLRKTLTAVSKAIEGYPYHIHYAMKANAEEKLLKIIGEHGFGVDCVSGNEIMLALENGFRPEQVVFAGVGKTDKELVDAIGHDVYNINCESIEELPVISEIAKKLNKTTKISFRLNPNIDARTHPHITTGKSINKFGIPAKSIWDALEELEKYPNLIFNGLHFHIGSQIRDMEPFKELCLEINKIQEALTDKGYHPTNLNVGGGLGIDYLNPEENLIPDFESYFDVFKEHLKPLEGQQIHFELGRSIIGQAGSLITKVLYVKKTADKHFAIIDAGMSDFMRPALYASVHKIDNLTSDLPVRSYEVVGPICESTDSFGNVMLNEVRRGDILRIWSTGAYGTVLSSRYNLRDKAENIYSDEVNIGLLASSTPKS